MSRADHPRSGGLAADGTIAEAPGPRAEAAGLSAAERAILEDGGSVAMPVVAEEVIVSRREVESGRVRVRIAPVTEDRVAHVDVGRTEVAVERVPVGREVDEYPQERIDGDTRIIPVVEERLVVTKRFFLVEEIHVRRRRIEERRDIPVTLTRDAVSIERLPPQRGPLEE